jgi:hypothetical protein
VVAVVGDLLDRLPRDAGDLVVDAVAQAAVERELVSRDEQLPGHGHAEVVVGSLDDLQVQEVSLVPEVGKVVLGASGTFDQPCVGEQTARLPEQVERDVAERDVLLQLRCPRDPLTQSLRQDQRVVAEPEGVGGNRRQGGGRLASRGAHRCWTSSGMS